MKVKLHLRVQQLKDYSLSPVESQRTLQVFVGHNFSSIELWNAVTHGLGFVLCLFGSIDLAHLTSGCDPLVKMSCMLYIASAGFLFLASTV